MVVLNDMKRAKLLLEAKEKEASEVATENYSKRKKKSNPKVQCDADLCLLFGTFYVCLSGVVNVLCLHFMKVLL